MIRPAIAAIITTVLAACTGAQDSHPSVSEPLSSAEIVSGYTFLTAGTKALQDDPFANPGFLWVDRGAVLFESGEGVSQPCQSCHMDGLRGVSVTYPKVDPDTSMLLNLEGRINQCRETHQGVPALAYESEDLLALTAYIAEQSSGLPILVETTGVASEHIDAGRDYFFTRRGQFNLSCHQCHDQNWGKKLRGDTISQGHSNGFPAYRLEWQSLGSLHRRLQDCDLGVRAEPHSLGSKTYTEVELYLAARAAGLVSEAPAVRR